MPCFVPPQYRHLNWHVIRMELIPGEPTTWERAEWVNCEENGPTEGGHWIRWGRCGDFPSLCKARYIGPSLDQTSPYFELQNGPLRMMDDHETLSRARNELADALKVLLNPGIMGEGDFRKSLGHAHNAVEALYVLLRQPHRDASQS